MLWCLAKVAKGVVKEKKEARSCETSQAAVRRTTVNHQLSEEGKAKGVEAGEPCQPRSLAPPLSLTSLLARLQESRAARCVVHVGALLARARTHDEVQNGHP